jgi:hypothetical protein
MDADVEILVVIQDAHLGPLAGRLALLRLVLEKARRHWCVAPRDLIERPVEGDGGLDPHRLEPAILAQRCVVDGAGPTQRPR